MPGRAARHAGVAAHARHELSGWASPGPKPSVPGQVRAGPKNRAPCGVGGPHAAWTSMAAAHAMQSGCFRRNEHWLLLHRPPITPMPGFVDLLYIPFFIWSLAPCLHHCSASISQGKLYWPLSASKKQTNSGSDPCSFFSSGRIKIAF